MLESTPSQSDLLPEYVGDFFQSQLHLSTHLSSNYGKRVMKTRRLRMAFYFFGTILQRKDGNGCFYGPVPLEHSHLKLTL